MAVAPVKVIRVVMDPVPMFRLREFLDHGITRRAMNEQLNYLARKATTQVRRHLASQTKLPYSYMMKAVSLIPSWPEALMAVIKVEDKATTLGRFMTSYTKRPTSWRRKGWQQKMRLNVWSGGQIFPKNPNAKPFVIDGGRSVKLIAVRKGKGRTPIKVLSGPNLSGSRDDTGEISRLETGTYVKVQLPLEFTLAVDERIDRLIAAAPVR